MTKKSQVCAVTLTSNTIVPRPPLGLLHHSRILWKHIYFFILKIYYFNIFPSKIILLKKYLLLKYQTNSISYWSILIPSIPLFTATS